MSPPALEVSSLNRDFQGQIKLSGSGKGAPCGTHGPQVQPHTKVSIVSVSLFIFLFSALGSYSFHNLSGDDLGPPGGIQDALSNKDI